MTKNPKSNSTLNPNPSPSPSPKNIPLLLCLSLTLLVFSKDSAASVVLKTDTAKRLSVNISADSMNRIAFANDRIAQVFGDEDAYTLQSDETRGQIFLKPTQANGEKPISITLTTELNGVQDMELIPQKIPTRTIILKGEGKEASKPTTAKGSEFGLDGDAHSKFRSRGFGMPSLEFSSSAQQVNASMNRPSQLIGFIKEVAGLSMSELESGSSEDKPTPLTIANLKVEGVCVVSKPNCSLSLYRLTNTSETDLEVSENAFVDGKVLAISVENRLLKQGESTRLFVVRSV